MLCFCIYWIWSIQVYKEHKLTIQGVKNTNKFFYQCRLQRWSFFSCDAMVMFYFLQRCDIDYFWTFPTIAIVAIIFPIHRDRLSCNVCIILRFLGVFEGFWRFWVLFTYFWRFWVGFWRFWGIFEGSFRFRGVFKVNITIAAIISTVGAL